MSKPTFEQMEELFAQIHSGFVTRAKLQVFLNGVATPEPEFGNAFLLSIDYRLTIAQMAAAARVYSSDINEATFPHRCEGEVVVTVELMKFEQETETPMALANIGAQGYRPGTMAEMLCLAEQHPNVVRRFPVVALGSVCRDTYGRAYCGHIHRPFGESILHVSDYLNKWREACCFLVVKKTESELQRDMD